MTLVFCFKTIFRNSHRKIFKLDELITRGHKVILLELSSLYGGNPTCDDDLMLRLREKCTNEHDLINFRNSLPVEPVIFVCNDDYLSSMYSAFKLIKRKQDRLLAFRIKPTPFLHDAEKGIKLALKKIFEKWEFLPSHKLKKIYLKNHRYYAPDYYLCNTRYYLPLKAYLTVKRDNILFAHSDDVNRVLDDSKPIQQEEKTGVFLDQILPFAYKNSPKELFEDYYENISKTLLELKEYFKLDRIIIAEHPESVAIAKELEDKYQDFDRVRDKSQEVIKNASYVFAHYSTSIGLAVYYHKPVILLIDDKIRRIEHISMAVNRYQKILKLPVVDIRERNFSDLEDIHIDQNLYQEYVLKYMKDNDIKQHSYHFALDRIIRDIQDKIKPN